VAGAHLDEPSPSLNSSALHNFISSFHFTIHRFISRGYSFGEKMARPERRTEFIPFEPQKRNKFRSPFASGTTLATK
jgi:hypothetical protein